MDIARIFPVHAYLYKSRSCCVHYALMHWLPICANELTVRFATDLFMGSFFLAQPANPQTNSCHIRAPTQEDAKSLLSVKRVLFFVTFLYTLCQSRFFFTGVQSWMFSAIFVSDLETLAEYNCNSARFNHRIIIKNNSMGSVQLMAKCVIRLARFFQHHVILNSKIY